MNPVFYFGKADIHNPLSLRLNKNIIHKIFPAVRI